RHRSHALPAGRADDRSPLRGRRTAAAGAAPPGRPRQHGGGDRAQPRRPEDRRLAHRPRARGRREGRLRDRGGYAGGPDADAELRDRRVPAAAAREGAQGPGAVERGRHPSAPRQSQSGRRLRTKPATAGYGALLRVPGFARLYAGLLLGRAGGSMWLLILVLFVLQRYHSPQLAGITAFLAIVPGLLLAPIAGALLDRHGRARLVVADYLIAAFAAALIATLSALHELPQPLLLVIVAFASLTNPLSIAGARTLFPVIAPREMWERANALDSSGHVIASLVAAPLAGVLVGLVGGEWALAAAAAIFGLAALVMLRLPDPSTGVEGSILRNAWLGLQYVVRNATLRGIAITMFTLNLGTGALTII